jgi:hypothetical protein
MQNRELSRQHQALVGLFARVDVACGDDIEMRSHWARYLCVLSAGFVENGVKEVLTTYAEGAAGRPIANYAAFHLRQIQNPKTYRLLDIAGTFRPDWRDKLEAFVDVDGRREAIDSIMQNRHQVAHGQQSSVTLVRVKEYLTKAVAVISYLEQLSVN